MGTRLIGELNDKVNKNVKAKTVSLDLSNGNQVVSESGSVFSQVTITKDTDFIASNIRKGKTLGNIEGACSEFGSANASAGDIKAGKKATVGGVDIEGTLEVNTETSKTYTVNGTYTIETEGKMCEEDITVNVNVDGVIINESKVSKEIAKTDSYSSSVDGGTFVTFANQSYNSSTLYENGDTLDNNLEVFNSNNNAVRLKRYNDGYVYVELYQKVTTGNDTRYKLKDTLQLFLISDGYCSTAYHVAEMSSGVYYLPYLYRQSGYVYVDVFRFQVENNQIVNYLHYTPVQVSSSSSYNAWGGVNDDSSPQRLVYDSTHIGFIYGGGPSNSSQYAFYIKLEITISGDTMTATGTPVTDSSGNSAKTGPIRRIYELEDDYLAIESTHYFNSSSYPLCIFVVKVVGNDYTYSLEYVSYKYCEFYNASYPSTYVNVHFYKLDNHNFLYANSSGNSSGNYALTVGKFNISDDYSTITVKWQTGYTKYQYCQSRWVEWLVNNNIYYLVSGSYVRYSSSTSSVYTPIIFKITDNTSSATLNLNIFGCHNDTNNISVGQGGKIVVEENDIISVYELKDIEKYNVNSFITPLTTATSSITTTKLGFIAENGTFESGDTVQVAIVGA